MFHTFDICQSIAEKLQNLNQPNVSAMLKDWNETSLISGWPCLTLFYSILDGHFPNQKFDQLAHEYLTLSLSKAYPSSSISLYNGVSGLCYLAHVCSQDGLRYKKLLAQLDQQLTEEIKKFLQNIDQSIDDYNLLNGLSGVLAYLLLRPDDPLLSFYAKQCLSSLVNYVQSKKMASGYYVPSWYEESTNSPLGKFTLNSLHGVSGLLSSLALASINGVVVEGQQETILYLAEWIKNKQKVSSKGPTWPVVVSLEEEIGEKEDELILFPNTWCYGSSAIARSLYLGYKAVGKQDLKEYAEQLFLQTISLPHKNFSASFGFGKAGLLVMAYRMYQDTQNRLLLQKINELEYELKNTFDPNSLFGFQTRDLSTERQLIDDPGILNGAIGVALALLLVEGKQDLSWDRLFLLR